MNPEQAAKLREPFPPEKIGKLPKGGKQLDFVGHAWVTDRLLQVDPEWTFSVTSTYERGKWTVMWIELRVAGVTRPGVGIAPTSFEDCEKLLVSDALKNAAMRFGVALDLWGKEEHHPTKNVGDPGSPPTRQQAPGPSGGPGVCANCGKEIGSFPEATKKKGKWVHAEPCDTPADTVKAAFPGTEEIQYKEGEEPF